VGRQGGGRESERVRAERPSSPLGACVTLGWASCDCVRGGAEGGLRGLGVAATLKRGRVLVSTRMADTAEHSRRARRRQVRFDEASLVVQDAGEVEVGTEKVGKSHEEESAESQERALVPGKKPSHKLKERRPSSKRRNVEKRQAEEMSLKFVQARKSNNLPLMEEVLDALQMSPPNGFLRKRLDQFVLDENLMYAMLSNNVEMTRLLIREGGASVLGADTVYDEMKGDMGNCDCGSHPGFLLISLVRSGSHEMVEIGLRGELNPNSSVCDGAPKTISWGIGLTLQGLNTVRTPVLKSTFSRTTALSAAAINNDLRMCKMLIEHGARVDEHDYCAVAEAALVNDRHHRVLGHFLKSFKDYGKYSAACSIALKAAASSGDASTVQWILDRIDENEEWNVKTRRKPARKTSGSKGGGLQPQPLPYSRTAPRRPGSDCSNGSGGGRKRGDASIIKQSSMKEYENRRRSVLRGSRSFGNMTPEELAQTVSSSTVSSSPTLKVKPAIDRKNDLVSKVVATAIQTLIVEASQPGFIHKEAFARGLECLAEIERTRVGSAVTVDKCTPQLFSIFSELLSQEATQSLEETALVLLNNGIGSFLGLSGGKMGVRRSNSVRLSQKFIGNFLTSSSTSRTRPPSGMIVSKSATPEEINKTLTLATSAGYTKILSHILSQAGRKVHVTIPRLLQTAARFDKVEAYDILMNYFPSYKNEQMTNRAQVECISSCFFLALECEAVDFARFLLTKEVQTTKEIFLDVIHIYVKDPAKKDESAEFLVETLEQLGYRLTVQDVEGIVEEICSSEEPNLYSLASVLDLDESFRSAVKPEHLLRLVESSTKTPTIADWAELCMMLIKCLESTSSEAQVQKAIQAAYEAITTSSPVNPQLLHVLMEAAKQEPDPERWV